MEIRFKVPDSYLEKYNIVEKDLGIKTGSAVFLYLIDLYFLEKPQDVDVLKKILIRRIKSGIGLNMFLSLRLLFKVIKNTVISNDNILFISTRQ